jgi:DNA end-binding protein Ku
MRPIWTGSIGFGLVNIPVKLFSASQASEIDFDMLDKKDHENIRFMRVNARTHKEVKWENIVKGFKIKDRYVILEDADFEKANVEKTKMIQIDDFVSLEEIPFFYFETPYYLVPEKNGTRAYALLREALLKSKKAGVASFVLRNKENLAILSAQGDMIVLNKIRFAEEIKSPEEFSVPSRTSVKASELKMAVSLINQHSKKFNINKYKDKYAAQLMKTIRLKAKGKLPKTPVMKVVHHKTADLMDQLKASLKPTRKKAS